MNEELLNEFMNILKEKNIDTSEILDFLSSEDSDKNKSEKVQDNNSSNNFNNIDINTILKLKKLFDKYQNISSYDVNLLMAIKPYLKESRRSKVDKYVKMLKIAEVLKYLDLFGGE